MAECYYYAGSEAFGREGQAQSIPVIAKSQEKITFGNTSRDNDVDICGSHTISNSSITFKAIAC